METLEKSRMCRLCGKQSGISIDLFDKNENHVKKINAILPIMVHEMDMLPKQMCHRCSYKLEEFYNFYTVCVKTDSDLKSQLSWMRKEDYEEKIVTPMVKMNRFKIKTEPADDNSDPSNNSRQMSGGTLMIPTSILKYNPSSPPCSKCKCLCNKSVDKEMKASSSDMENQAHSSQAHSNKKDLGESVDSNCKKNLFHNSNSKQMVLKPIPIVSLENCMNVTDSELESVNKNRALRPRKNSVDYTGPKKKGAATNLKAKLQSKMLDMLDPTLVNPVDIKMSQGNSAHPSPMIKLEKVDETMMNLRTRKNLETFEKRIKELKKDLRKRQNHSNKSSWTIEKKNRKSLQKADNHNENEQNLEISSESSEQTGAIKTSFQSEDDGKNKRDQKSLNVVSPVDSNEIVVLTDLKIKQEEVVEILEEPLENNSVQETVETNSAEIQSKSAHRQPICAVVKLEKDYTCNVDYPRIKIKRNLTAVDPSLNCTVDISPISAGLLETRSSLIKDKTLGFSKNSRSKEKNSRIGKINPKSRKSCKSKKKKLDLIQKNQVEFKRYCEKCDTSFRNKELYQLHSCYQK